LRVGLFETRYGVGFRVYVIDGARTSIPEPTLLRSIARDCPVTSAIWEIERRS
jgi:hypothetical protein